MPGPRSTAVINLDSAADPPGWRVANALAIAAPYLLGGALFLVLYFQPVGPPTQAPLPPSQAPAPGLSSPYAPVVARAAAPASPVSSPAAAPPAASSLTPPAAAPATDEPPLPTQPVAVDPDIAGTMRLSGAPPSYPPAANMAHIQGVAVVAVVVGANGVVQSVQPVSGPALLEAAALDAVRTWRYRPYLSYGRPVAFQTQVSIGFRINEPTQ